MARTSIASDTARWRQRFRFFGGLVAGAIGLAGCAASSDPFEVHRRQAVKDARTAEARAYERAFYPAIGSDLTQLLKKCTSEFPGVPGNSFEMVFKINHWGEPKAILVNPSTDVSDCVASGFWYFSFPHPAPRFEKTGLVLLLPIKIS